MKKTLLIIFLLFLTLFVTSALADSICLHGGVYMDCPSSLSYASTQTNYIVYKCWNPFVEVRLFNSGKPIAMTFDELVQSSKELTELLDGYTMSTKKYTNIDLVILKSNNSAAYNKPVYTAQFIDHGIKYQVEFHDRDNTTSSQNYIVDMIKNISRLSNTKVDWVCANGNLYFYRNGKKLIGAQTIGEYIYLFDENGIRQEGWQYTDKGWRLWAPELVNTGLARVDGVFHYFSSDGYAIEGWQEINGTLYYFSPERVESCVYIIDDIPYCFNDNGTLYKNGLFQYNDMTFFANTDGTCYTGWKTLNGKKYYFTPVMCQSGVFDVDDNSYCFNNDGTLFTSGGLFYSDEDTCYANTDGTAFIGWKTINGKKYYFGPFMLKADSYIINDKIYKFNNDGTLFTNGFFTIDDMTFYAGNDGAAYEGWKTINGKKYYFLPEMLASYAYYLDDALYCFNDDGSLFTNGWFKSSSGAYFYADQYGRSSLGWKPEENEWYYVEGQDDNREKNYNTLILPDGITTIEAEAFEGINAQVVVLPRNCQKVESNAFSSCANLKYIVSFSDSVWIASDAYNKSTCQVIMAPKK